jgi:hypothetical protein
VVGWNGAVASGRRRLTLLLAAVALAASAAAGGWTLRPDARHATDPPAAADRPASVRAGTDADANPAPRSVTARPFHDLDRLRPGDPLVFTLADGTSWTYEHTSTEIVGPDAVHIVDQTPEHTATLFACHPKGSNAQRIVTHLRLTTPPPT